MFGLFNSTSKVSDATQDVSFGQLVEEYHNPAIAKTAIKIGVLAVVVFLFWASVSPVHEVTTGTGAVIPSGFSQKLPHLEGGHVAQILVSEGDRVQAGQVMVVLDDTSIQAELTKAKARAESIRLSIASQQSGVTPVNSVFEGDVALRGVIESQADTQLLNQTFRQSQLEVINAEIRMGKTELSGINNQLSKTREESALLNRQLNDYENALKQGAISKRERDTLARDVIRIDAQVEGLVDRVATMQAKIATDQAREQELSIRIKHETSSEIVDLEVQQVEALQLITQLNDRINRTNITATQVGIVHNLAIRNVGEVINPGEAVLEVVPETNSIFAEVEVTSDKIGYIQKGTKASVKVLTYEFSRFGTLEGIVSDVSASSFVRDDGTRYYRVRLDLSDNFVGTEAAGRQVLPGMAVAADFKLGQKSIMSYLLKPLRAVSDRALTEK